MPVVAVATAAPAYANHSTPIIVSSSGTACKHQGLGQNSKNYHFTFCFQNTSGFSITVNLTNMNVNGADGAVSPSVVQVPAGETVCKYVDASNFGNSANGLAILSYNFVVNDEIITETFSASVVTKENGLPPCGNPEKAPNEPTEPPPHVPDGPVRVTA